MFFERCAGTLSKRQAERATGPRLVERSCFFIASDRKRCSGRGHPRRLALRMNDRDAGWTGDNSRTILGRLPSWPQRQQGRSVLGSAWMNRPD